MKTTNPNLPDRAWVVPTWDRLRRALTGIPLVKGWQENLEAVGTHIRYDGLIHLEVSDRPWVIVIEEKSTANLRDIQACHWHFTKARNEFIHQGEAAVYGVLLCPYVSEESAKDCEAIGIGYADSVGNMHIAFDGLFLSRRVDIRPKREKQTAKTLYSPQAARVLRTLLSPPVRPWKIRELHEVTGVSIGLIGKVRQKLVESIGVKSTSAGIELHSQELLLRDWIKAPVPPKDRQRWQGFHSLLSRDQLESKLKDLMREIRPQRVKEMADPDYARILFGSFSAAKWLAPFAKNPNTFLYADEAGLELLKSRLGLQPVETGATVFVCVTDDPTIVDRPAEGTPPDIRCAGLVQTALDLAQSGDRGREAAEELINQRLKPLWENARHA